MARTVDEIMNKELFAVRPTDAAEDVIGLITAMGITGAAVVDPDGMPVGHVSLRDLLREGGRRPVSELMVTPAATIPAAETIENAARRLAEQNRHRLVVVDADGRAFGMVSSLDVIRGLLGLPAVHPQAFPHFDAATGLTWTDDTALDLTRVEAAPNGPGLLSLVYGGAGMRERVVWVEGCHNVRTRLFEILSAPHREQPMLARALRLGNLRFRAASAPDAAARERAREVVQGMAMAALRPSPKVAAA
jgi:CBS domain-containing protein